MNAPDTNVVAFPGVKPDGLRWHALGLANAARAAADALALSHQLAAHLAACAQDGRALADQAATCVPQAECEAQAGLCRSLGRQLAAL